MKVFNNWEGQKNEVLIGHFPGKTKASNMYLINQFKDIIFKLPDNVTILSPITADKIPSSPIHYQIALNGYKYINPVADRLMLWNRANKANIIYQGLQYCPTEYCLIVDGNDVVIMNDLTDIINKFNVYNKDILYNPTCYMYPHIVVDSVENRDELGKYNYLNAGCCIGKTQSLLKFYKEVKNEVNNTYHPIDSEQYYIRKIFDKHQDTVFFDYKSLIFQCWHKVKINAIQLEDIYI